MGRWELLDEVTTGMQEITPLGHLAGYYDLE
jgi:hypothetical protein